MENVSPYKFIVIRSALAALLILFLNASSFSQQLEANWWYFGMQAGVHFSNGYAESDTNGIINSVTTAATISDSNGDLLFYTSGLNVYNKNHQLMPNGNLPLFGTAARGLIVPTPNRPNIYHVFFTRVGVGSSWQLNYYTVDMDLDNGLGDVNVSSLNQLSDTINLGLACLDHANGIDKWILVHDINNYSYKAFLLDSNGLDSNFIETVIGDNSTNPTAIIGHIKSSPNSNMFVSVHRQPLLLFEVFDFDNSTGLVNSVIFRRPFAPGINEISTASFSPNSKVLYIGHRTRLFQYNLESLDSNQIALTEIVIDSVPSTSPPSYLDFQLAVDGKIYAIIVKDFPYPRKLSVITCPNVLGIGCNFIDTVVDLDNRMPGNQLPALNQTLFVNAHILQAQNKSGPICPGDSARLVAYGAGADRFIWTLQDGSAANSLSNDTLPNPLAFPDSTTTYRVVGIASSCTVDNLDTAYITVVVNPTPSSPFGNAVLVCNNDTASLSLPFASNVLWSTGDTSQNIQLSQQGSYWFVYTDSNGCQSDTLHFQVQEQDSGKIQLNAPNQVCANQTVEVTASGASPVVWQNVGNPIVVDSQRLVFRADTSFWLVASSASPCILPDSVFVEVIPAPHFGANTDSVLCLPDSFSFSPNTTNQSNLRFVWLGEADTLSMSDFPQKFWVDSILSKQLIAFVFSGCYDTLDVQLRVKETDVLPNSAFELKQSCEGLLLEIFPENNSLWFVNGVLQSANNLKVNPGDTLMKITQSSTDSCFAKEQIRLGGEGAQNQLADLANVFTPNGDGINDVFGPKNPSDFLCAELRIYNRWGWLVFQSKVGSPPVWDGRSPSALEMPEGVYFYTFSIGDESQKGSVNLMR